VVVGDRPVLWRRNVVRSAANEERGYTKRCETAHTI
jgi:hypothetical protein